MKEPLYIENKVAETKSTPLYFEVSTGLKRVLGRELITNDEVAIFEMVKNSFDAEANAVHIYFGDDSIVVADNGHGMSLEDLKTKWLFVAYSEKRQRAKGEKDFRDVVAERGHFAGSKGIGRFSSDRLGGELILQSRPSTPKDGPIHRLSINWEDFEQNDTQHFETVPVSYQEESAFRYPNELQEFAGQLHHGTLIEIKSLIQRWDRQAILALKASLAKLINPFGSDIDKFSITITAPKQVAEDVRISEAAKRDNSRPLAKDLVNGRVGNFIFADLQEKTTYISVKIESGHICTTLTDRGELVYRIRENNIYDLLENADFQFEIYYLNQSAKVTFARRVGLPSVQFGSVFLFRNGFRVYPIGEDGDDWFGFGRRKQQGYARYLGTREIIGRVDVSGSDRDFQEASSRNQGLIETAAVRQLQEAVMEKGVKRLEKYVVPVSWKGKDEFDDAGSDLSLLLTDPGRARVSAAVANLVDNEKIELVDYSKKLIGLLNERSNEFEASLVSLRLIAEKTNDQAMLGRLDKAEERFEELRKSEAEAVRVAELARVASQAATKRAETAEAAVEHERRRAHFLESVVSLDTATILNLHHQVTIYAVDIGQQVENLLTATSGQDQISREVLLSALEQIAYLNRKVLAVTRFAAKAKFKLDSETIKGDIANFISEYIESVAQAATGARTRIEVENTHPGLTTRFDPIDISIVVDNLISNARRARASRVRFEIAKPPNGSGLVLRVSDNGSGLARGVDKDRIFEMGYTTTSGSGLGLYHVRQVLGEIGGSIEYEDGASKGATFIIRLSGRKAQ
jgi:signal transduction histidine kinase